ncbi:uncharacterized protein [Centruroides vittatus]|uniref:uncharacterized protein n=1 Tax=Centruroides vittatus TaxID=120091 RepID=UPI003510CAFC
MMLALKIEGAALRKDEKRDLTDMERLKNKRNFSKNFERWIKLARIVKSLKILERTLRNEPHDKETRISNVNDVTDAMSAFSGTEWTNIIKPKLARMFYLKQLSFDSCMIDEVHSMVKEFDRYSECMQRLAFFSLDKNYLDQINNSG